MTMNKLLQLRANPRQTAWRHHSARGIHTPYSRQMFRTCSFTHSHTFCCLIDIVGMLCASQYHTNIQKKNKRRDQHSLRELENEWTVDVLKLQCWCYVDDGHDSLPSQVNRCYHFYIIYLFCSVYVCLFHIQRAPNLIIIGWLRTTTPCHGCVHCTYTHTHIWIYSLSPFTVSDRFESALKHDQWTHAMRKKIRTRLAMIDAYAI